MTNPYHGAKNAWHDVSDDEQSHHEEYWSTLLLGPSHLEYKVNKTILCHSHFQSCLQIVHSNFCLLPDERSFHQEQYLQNLLCLNSWNRNRSHQGMSMLLVLWEQQHHHICNTTWYTNKAVLGPECCQHYGTAETDFSCQCPDCQYRNLSPLGWRMIVVTSVPPHRGLGNVNYCACYLLTVWMLLLKMMIWHRKVLGAAAVAVVVVLSVDVSSSCDVLFLASSSRHNSNNHSLNRNNSKQYVKTHHEHTGTEDCQRSTSRSASVGCQILHIPLSLPSPGQSAGRCSHTLQ